MAHPAFDFPPSTSTLSLGAKDIYHTITESRAYEALFHTRLGRAFVGTIVFGALATVCVLTGGLPLIAAVALPIILKGGVAAVALKAGTVIGCAAIGAVGGAFWHRHEVRWLTCAAFGVVLGGALAVPLAALPAPFLLGAGGFLGLVGRAGKDRLINPGTDPQIMRESIVAVKNYTPETGSSLGRVHIDVRTLRKMQCLGFDELSDTAAYYELDFDLETDRITLARLLNGGWRLPIDETTLNGLNGWQKDGYKFIFADDGYAEAQEIQEQRNDC